ncbi:MAG: right-handed parallel beta-helix repeat-containing protein [Clostridiales bacterium]|nr:right-handed parallel beta-helix repeat-containing protein [Clostridiales bacterium]
METTNLEKLCESLSHKVKLYPIKNIVLSDETDYIRSGYMRMLAVILRQSRNITDAQLTTFKRMLAGTKTENRDSDYLRMASETEIEDFHDFINEMKTKTIRYRFVGDALVLAGLGENRQETLGLAVAFAEELEIGKDELRYLGIMAKSVLCMDPDDLIRAELLKPDSVPEDTFAGYMNLLAENCLVGNDELIIFQPASSEDVTLERLNLVSGAPAKNIRIKNAAINLQELALSFAGKTEIILENCTFVGGDKHSLSFVDCENVEIKNCRFSGFRVRTIISQKVQILNIRDSVFDHCEYVHSDTREDWLPLGGVLYFTDGIDDKCAVNISGCEFDSCGGRNSENYYRSTIIANAVCQLDHTTFRNCWHYHFDTSVDPKNSARTLFAPDSSALDCVFENSAYFCQKSEINSNTSYFTRKGYDASKKAAIEAAKQLKKISSQQLVKGIRLEKIEGLDEASGFTVNEVIMDEEEE